MRIIKIVESVNSIPRQEWNQMSGDNVFASHGWLKTVEETSNYALRPLYFLLMEFNKLIGAAVCYRYIKNEDGRNLDDTLLGRLKDTASKLGISFLPVFICSPFRCYGKHFLIEKGASKCRTELIIVNLLDSIEKETKKRKISLAFSNIMKDENSLIKILNRRQYRWTVSYPLSYLDIQWSTFEEYRKYIKGISSNMESNIRKEINKNKREGVVIERLDRIDGHEDRLYELSNNNYRKYNKTPFPYNKNFFKQLMVNLGSDAHIYISRKNGYLTGMSILLKKYGIGYIPIVGVDHEMAGNDATYFNITFYKPLQDAMDWKMKRIYYGNAMYDLKTRRGSKLEDTYIFLKSFNPIKNLAAKYWFMIHRIWLSRKIPKQIRDRCLPCGSTSN